jgi:hypothetical protein
VRVSLLVLAAVVCVAVAGAASEARAAETIVILRQPELANEGEMLVEAMRIYAGNLGCEVRDQPGAPLVLDVDALDRLQSAARDAHADFVLWPGRPAGGHSLYYTLDLSTGDLRETEIGAAGPETAAEEVALKVRALVSSRRRSTAPRPSAGARAPEGAAAPASGGPGALAETTTTPPAGAEPPAAPAAQAQAPPSVPPPTAEGARAAPAASLVATATPPPSSGAPRRPSRVELGAGFGITSPRDRTWLRNGLVLDASARLGSRSRVWAYVEGALTTRPSAEVRGFEVTFRDIPVTAGARFRIAMTHGNVVLGSRTSLHLLDVTAAAPDGRAASSRRYGLGLGAEALAEAGLGYHLKAFLGVSLEALVPSQQFTIAGQPAVATGDVLYGATAGLSLALP